MNSRSYALWGAAVGVLFAAACTVLQALVDSSASGFPSRLAAAQETPLLWIIDTTPVFLGVMAAMVGRREDQRLAAEADERTQASRTSAELLRSAKELLATVSSFSAITAQTATSVRETTGTMGQLSHTATHAALTAETVVGCALSSRRCSEDGQRAVQNATNEMMQLAGDVRELSGRVETLNECMREMFQVASALNSQEVKQLLGKAHKCMMAAMSAAEKGIQRAEHAAEVASATGETIQRLAAALDDSQKAARSIAEVAQLQDRGVDEVLKAMNEIYLATEQTAAGIQKVAGGAHALEELAERLGRSVPS